MLPTVLISLTSLISCFCQEVEFIPSRLSSTEGSKQDITHPTAKQDKRKCCLVFTVLGNCQLVNKPGSLHFSAEKKTQQERELMMTVSAFSVQ